MTGDRVEAAAKTLHHAEWVEGNFHETDAEHCWTQDPADHKGYYDQVRIVLNAADEADRVAGVVRLDTREDTTFKLIRRACNDPGQFLPHGEQYDGEPDTLGHWQALAVLAALAAAGVQPSPPEGGQQ